MKKSEQKKAARKGILALVIVLVIAAGIVIGVIVSNSNKKSVDPVPAGSGTIESSTDKIEEKITNFVIFGIDDVGYTAADINRSDTIMIVSINQDRNAVKLISILRDSKVPIKGYEPQKINAAYQLGGSGLAIDTLNDNFHLKLRNYITVNFAKMISLIDQIGGVDVELTQDEADIVNSQCPDSDWVEEGSNHLTGEQALAYSRIRKIDSDYDRANRQQNVMNAVLHKIRTMGTAKSLGLLDTFMETVETSYFYNDLYDILSPLDMLNMTLSRYIVPSSDVNPEVTGGLDETGSWVWQYDLEKAASFINEELAWK